MNGPLFFGSPLKDRGPKEGRDHRNVWGEDHKHPPGKPYAETALSDKKRAEFVAKGAEFDISENDPHNVNAKKMECADKGGTWVNGKCVLKKKQ